MIDLISSAIAQLNTLLKGLQVKRFLAVVLVGFILLTTNAAPQQNNKALGDKIREQAHQDGGQRPKTTGEWLGEAQQDVPLKQRVKDITEDSAEAFKEFGSEYADGARQTARKVRDGAVQAGKDLSN